MITPQELRIGNLVMDRGDKFLTIDRFDGNKIECDVKGMPEKTIAGIKQHYHPYTEEIEYLKPIPITEYMLVTYGFKYVTNSWLQIKYATNCDEVHQISINLISGRFSIMDDIDDTTPVFAAYTVRYLHQLQNLYFALTGNELKVNAE